MTTIILSSLLFVAVVVAFFLLIQNQKKAVLLAQLQQRETYLQKELTEGQAALGGIKQEMKDAFASLASETLKGSNEEFLKMAEMKFAQQAQRSSMELDTKQSQIHNIVEPLKKTLGLFKEEVTAMERERQRSYALVEGELKRVVANSVELSKETRALKNALKKPNIRGQWGEIQLKNCIELAGMSEFADVSFQDHSLQDGKRLIPDMTVNMPGGRKVIVDAKTPLDGFLNSLEADTEALRKTEMIRHGKSVKNHIVELSKKSYGGIMAESADFTVMFLPNESFLYAALETQPDLVEYAMEKKILVATPPTFVGLLKVIRYGWNEDRLTKNAQEISEIGKELHKRVADFMDAYTGIGKSLSDAQTKYDQGFSRLQSRVLVQARKMEKLGAKSHKDLPAEL